MPLIYWPEGISQYGPSAPPELMKLVITPSIAGSIVLRVPFALTGSLSTTPPLSGNLGTSNGGARTFPFDARRERSVVR